MAKEDLKPGLDPNPLAERVTLKAATAGNGEGYAVLTLAEAMGEFEKENIDVQIEVVSPASTIFALMAQNRLDLAVTAPFAGMFNQAADGSNIRFVTGGGEVAKAADAGWWQRPGGDGTTSACDLKGKSVAIQTGGEGNPLAVSLDTYLNSCELSIKDVTLVELTPPETVQALQNGAVELGSVALPFAKALKESGDAVLVAPWNKGIIGTIMGNLIEDRPEVAQAVVRAMLRTARTHLQGNYYSDPDVLTALSKIIGVEESVLKAGVPRNFDPNLAPPLDSVVPLEEFWIRVGGLLNYDKPLGVDKITDSKVLESVLR
ncbi:ABC transporter substrate-binding protein [Pseudarthrobacter sulfonivorans]|uniref:ABC transporter substrate-binding protein n=1 Tax=Pseudarthrobacter sulfonivorans TaxID=121292 RepID=UPI00168A9527|nr:ABC transporter substrate-binding protein [Pseudarthrobacter sulfonivorans]